MADVQLAGCWWQELRRKTSMVFKRSQLELVGFIRINMEVMRKTWFFEERRFCEERDVIGLMLNPISLKQLEDEIKLVWEIGQDKRGKLRDVQGRETREKEKKRRQKLGENTYH